MLVDVTVVPAESQQPAQRQAKLGRGLTRSRGHNQACIRHVRRRGTDDYHRVRSCGAAAMLERASDVRISYLRLRLDRDCCISDENLAWRERKEESAPYVTTFWGIDELIDVVEAGES